MTRAASRLRLLRSLLWIMSAAPLADLLLRALTQSLGPHPEEAWLRGTGTWCLVLLLATLGVTPARRMMSWPDLIRLRRMLGLWSFAYGCVHLLGFLAFEHGMNLSALFADALKRPFVTAGLFAFGCMVPLALTSNRWSMQRLRDNWKKLHRLVYVAAAIGCLHFFLHRAGKANYGDPAIALAVFAALIAMRFNWMKTSGSPGSSRH